VVTLDRLENQRWAWLNDALGKSVRSQKWSIFGRSVAEWLADAEMGSGENVVSGDLEAATDNISTLATHAILRAVGEIYHLSDADLSQIHSFTCCADIFRGEGQPPLKQRRGQLMGSILSFPILCVFSAFCCREGLGEGGVHRFV
jgi:hypothetical protein